MTGHILITGIGGPAGRSAVNYFRRNGVPVIGTDIREVETPVESFYIIPPAGDPLFAATLLGIIKKERPSLLIPTVSEELPIISRLKRPIEGEGCTVLISPPAAVDIANDKLKTAMIMAGHGIPVPVSFDEKTSREFIAKELSFPLLSKPRVGQGGRGVTIYRNLEELFKETRTGLIFQEFIPGEEFDVNLFIGRRGETVDGVVLEKTFLKEGITGNAIAVERVEREDLIQLGETAAQVLGMEGPLDMDIRLRWDGTPVLLEINARLGENVLSAEEILEGLFMTWEKKERIDVHR
jgi:carbamoyl-phosphate synthase large subunit